METNRKRCKPTAYRWVWDYTAYICITFSRNIHISPPPSEVAGGVNLWKCSIYPLGISSFPLAVTHWLALVSMCCATAGPANSHVTCSSSMSRLVTPPMSVCFPDNSAFHGRSLHPCPKAPSYTQTVHKGSTNLYPLLFHLVRSSLIWTVPHLWNRLIPLTFRSDGPIFSAH